MRKAMTSPDRRRSSLTTIALVCTALLLATTGLSAFMRLSQAGLGCDDWPACYGQHLRDLQQGVIAAASTSAVTAARVTHRLVASAALLLVIRMVWATMVMKPRLQRPGVLASVLLLLALALALLGVVTPGATTPIVALGNLLGGFVMLALCWRLAAASAAPAASTTLDASASPSATERRGLGALGVVGVILLSVQIVCGAMVSTTFSGLSCGDLLECYRLAQGSGWDWQVLDPFRAPVFEAGSVPINPAGALVQLIHRLGAVFLLPVLIVLGLVAWRRGRQRGGALLLGLTIAQPMLGLLMVNAGLPLVPALLHNLVAALLLATLVRLV